MITARVLKGDCKDVLSEITDSSVDLNPGKWPNRFRDAWERCLRFTKSRKFKMNQEVVMVPMGDWANARLKSLGDNDVVRYDSQVGSGFGKNIANWTKREMAYPTNVLHLATECGNKNHSAAFSIALPEWFIKLFTDPGDVVLDPLVRRLYRTVSSVTLILALGACATHEPKSAAGEPLASATGPEPERIKSQPLKHLVGRTLKPIPDRALEVRAKCGFRNLSGGRGMLDLQVTKAQVKRFSAEVNIPKQGLCRFDMKDFQQTALLPNVVLTDAASGCVVRMWEQEKSVTVAFNACQSMCGGDAFSYLWPIVVDTRNGRCS